MKITIRRPGQPEIEVDIGEPSGRPRSGLTFAQLGWKTWILDQAANLRLKQNPTTEEIADTVRQVVASIHRRTR